MPTYQYRCTDCGSELEAVQRFTDPALTDCPSCTGPLRKVFNAVGVVFKGSGFYRTDSRADAKKADAGTSSGSPSTTSTDKSDSSGSSGGDKAGAKQPATVGSGSASSGGSSSSGSSTAA